MGKKIKIHIQYPWKISDSQYYKSLIDYPPKNVEYINDKKGVGIIADRKKFIISSSIRRSIRRFLEKLNITIPNAHFTHIKKKYDLIHCAHCLSKNNSPWVADFESLWQMWISGRNKKNGQKKVLKILENDNCKKIIAWTESTKKEILVKYPKIKEKVTLVSYAMPLPKFKKNGDKNIRLLFIGRDFGRKGGLHTLEAFDKLTKKYLNVKATFISTVPEKIKNRYSKNRKIEIYDLVPHNKLLKEIFPSSDIFVYPGYSDTFGFAFIEAFAFGLPIITVDGFARKDIISPGNTGFIINRPKNLNPNKITKKEKILIQQLVENTSKLIENKKLRNKMSKKCINMVKTGKFSIKERNKKLKKIYKEALN